MLAFPLELFSCLRNFPTAHTCVCVYISKVPDIVSPQSHYSLSFSWANNDRYEKQILWGFDSLFGGCSCEVVDGLSLSISWRTTSPQKDPLGAVMRRLACCSVTYIHASSTLLWGSRKKRRLNLIPFPFYFLFIIPGVTRTRRLSCLVCSCHCNESHRQAYPQKLNVPL